MAITIGEVNAKLIATSEMSQVAQQTAQSIGALTASLAVAKVEARSAAADLEKLASVSAAAGETSKASLAPALEQAGARASETSARVTGLSGQLKDLAPAADTGTSALDRMGAMADRLILRMGLLFAIKGSFDFVTGLFESAHQLEALSVQLDLSTDTLQTFKDAASQTLVPMTAMTTAVDALGKGISEGNSGLAQGLENIGLSFHAIATITYARRFACDAQRVEMERSRRNSGLQIVPQAAWVNPSDACVLNFGNSCAVMNVAAA